MDEKDRVITEIYNESKERARWEPVLLWPYLCFLKPHLSSHFFAKKMFFFVFVMCEYGTGSERVFSAVTQGQRF